MVKSFFIQVLQEFKKITWPSKEQYLRSYIMVIVCVMFFSLFFLALDSFVHYFVDFLLNIGS
ncbi:MAG: preprotein translocase subunit SecE [Methanobacteriaceae archaeon]